METFLLVLQESDKLNADLSSMTSHDNIVFLNISLHGFDVS